MIKRKKNKKNKQCEQRWLKFGVLFHVLEFMWFFATPRTLCTGLHDELFCAVRHDHSL